MNGSCVTAPAAVAVTRDDCVAAVAGGLVVAVGVAGG